MSTHGDNLERNVSSCAFLDDKGDSHLEIFYEKHRDEVGLGLVLFCLDQALPDRKDQIGDINCILAEAELVPPRTARTNGEREPHYKFHSSPPLY
jgi:hypothetical protein